MALDVPTGLVTQVASAAALGARGARYLPIAEHGPSPDGLAGEEATFSLCTFWWVEALARAGRLDQPRLAFEKMLTYANHVGPYCEEIGPTAEQLGNFPQSLTHLALISAACNLDRRLG
jgi:GH15 family glucan-1,4-alpha-glucosidase